MTTTQDNHQRLLRELTQATKMFDGLRVGVWLTAGTLGVEWFRVWRYDGTEGSDWVSANDAGGVSSVINAVVKSCVEEARRG